MKNAASRCGILLLALSAGGAPLWAQQAPPGPRLTLAEVVRTTLARNADIALGQWDVHSQEGALRQARGAFDPQALASVTSERAGNPSLGSAETGPSTTHTRGLDYTAGVEWRLRPGLVLAPSLAFNRQGVDTEGAPTRNTGMARLDLLVPLGRGRGGGGLRANERAASASLDASRGELRQLQALRVLDAVTAYWGYVAALQSLDVLRESEERAQTLVRQTELLIEADARPASDRLAVQASLASKRAARLGGEGAVSSARQALVRAVGLGAESFATLPLPADSLPVAPPGGAAAVPAEDASVAEALGRRPDLEAARSRVAAARASLRGSRSEVAPRVDLNVGVGYTGLESGAQFERLFSPFYAGTHGFNAQVAVSYGLPLARNVAAGQLMRSTAADRRASLFVDELTRQIALDAALAAETLRRAVQELEISREAVRLHRLSVESEIEKFKLGTSTLLEVIQVEDGRTGALLGWIGTRRRYAVAVAQLRFHTGALLGGGEGEGAADPERLTSWAPAAPRR